MGKQHSPGFIAIVDDAKTRIKETTVEQLMRRLRRGDSPTLVDVREIREYLQSHLSNSVHLSKGILERDIEEHFPDHDRELILYCGGGYRSALAADNLQKMGYTRVYSLAGGFKAWKSAGGTVTR